jgi:nitroreductase
MNAVLETIRDRRSIRSYKASPVPRETLETILRAGGQAPFFNGAWDIRPCGRIVVAEDEGFRHRLLQAALRTYEKWKASTPDDHALKSVRRELGVLDASDPVYYHAPVVVFVIGAGGVAPTSCNLACHNIMLAAKSLGLGSCWVAFGSFVRDDPEIAEALGLTEDEKIFGPIVLGYPDDDPAPPPRLEEPVVKWI